MITATAQVVGDTEQLRAATCAEVVQVCEAELAEQPTNEIHPLIWRDAMYSGKCDIMQDLHSREKDYFLGLLAELGDEVSFIEVGCGTAELNSFIVDKTKYCVGIDINPDCISVANEIHSNLRDSVSSYLLEGNAISLNDLLKENMPAEFWNTKRIVSMMTNTLSFLSVNDRKKAIEEMLKLAGDDGIVVVGCWCSGSFRVGVENFYKQNIALTGSVVTDDMCDFEGANLTVASTGYYAHWWSEAEIMEFFNGQEGIDIKCQVEGIGIFVSARKSTDSHQKSDISNAVWENELLPLLWRDAMYAGKCEIMEDLYSREKSYFVDLLSESDEEVSYIEVGCGTAELGSFLVDKTKYCVGVDINPVFISKAKELHPAMADSAYLFEGNAVHLNDLLVEKMPSEFWQTKRVVSIVMNTFGILPSCIRGQVIEEMLKLAGDDGVVVVGCWHSGSFHDGVEHFYKQNPELTGGEVTDDMCDFEGANLMVPSSGYSSHWWSEAEIMEYFNEHKGIDIKCQVEGIGIFVSARKA